MHSEGNFIGRAVKIVPLSVCEKLLGFSNVDIEKTMLDITRWILPHVQTDFRCIKAIIWANLFKEPSTIKIVNISKIFFSQETVGKVFTNKSFKLLEDSRAILLWEKKGKSYNVSDNE